jgi:hypothetical protein
MDGIHRHQLTTVTVLDQPGPFYSEINVTVMIDKTINDYQPALLSGPIGYHW